MLLDNEAPQLNIFVENDNIYETTKTAQIHISDEVSGLKANTYVVFHKWSKTALSCSDLTIANGAHSVTLEVKNDGDKHEEGIKVVTWDSDDGYGAGKLYACIKANVQDMAGNAYASSTVVSSKMYIAQNSLIECSYTNLNVNSEVTCHTNFPAGSSGSNEPLYYFDIVNGTGLEYISNDIVGSSGSGSSSSSGSGSSGSGSSSSSGSGSSSSSGSGTQYALADGEQLVVKFKVKNNSLPSELYVELNNLTGYTDAAPQTRTYLK